VSEQLLQQRAASALAEARLHKRLAAQHRRRARERMQLASSCAGSWARSASGSSSTAKLEDSMAPKRETATPADPDVLDLRELVERPVRVLTSVGELRLRRISTLGPLERARVAARLDEAERYAKQLDDDPPAGDESTSLVQLAEQLVDAENELLRRLVPGVTDEQLDALPAPERAGLIAAFYGATDAQARRAVAVTNAALLGRQTGARSSRASRGSTAATPSAG
jgi:hypothetical protein